MNKLTSWLSILLTVLLVAACEKPNINDDEEETEEQPDRVKLTLKVAGFDMTGFDVQSRASKNIADLCSRIDVAAYSPDGTRITKVSQDNSDDDFGTVTLSLPEGKCRIIALAHSCTGAATTTARNKITFPNNKVTDTFYYSEELDVSAEQQKQIQMHRAVAAFRLIVKEKTPSSVTQMKFYYTGGSSTFDGVEGVGCVKSRQTEIRPVTSDAYTGESQYMIYTFPHSDLTPLKIVVTAQDAAGNAVKEVTFEDVPIKVNQITQYTGNFFESNGGSGTRSGYTFYTDDEWTIANGTY